LSQRLPRLRERRLSGWRQFDPALRPKQARTELFLEAPYLLTERGLRDVKPRGCAAEM
jgi:hypothetical protein